MVSSVVVRFGLLIAMSLGVTSVCASTDLFGDVCLPPDPPYPYRLAQDDPLYQAARDEHQRYLEALETHIRCIDRQRGAALMELGASYRLFRKNFGSDAVYRYVDDANDTSTPKQ